MGEGMVELTNLITTTLYKPKFGSKKCDVESVTLWVQSTDQTFTIINWNFAQKSATQKVWPFTLGPVDNLNNYISINRNFAKKSDTKKVRPFGSSKQSKPFQLYTY